MVKYKEYFQKMVNENKDIFVAFKKVHDAYSKNKAMYQEEFNVQGDKVRKVIEEWDHRLCSYMEGGKNASYSAKLSEKFWDEVRIYFPLIDFVGVKVRKLS
jgi:hypothetical protein